MKITEVFQKDEATILLEARTHKLWESAGQKLVEAQLTIDQINQIFQQAETGVTAGGKNRTLIGKGKDAASAVNTAWEDLKTKIQNSGPIKNVDALYDQAAAKLKQATGGDKGVMQYVQKYRDFAKKHPISQSFIYAALIAAAGLSGAGVGGAAALGLLKMTDKLLQGSKFSSAAYSGAKTGALAYGASQLAQHLKGADQATNVPEPEPLNLNEPTYVIQKGDTLSDIAKANNVSVKDLMDLNPQITNPDFIKPGASIQIPSAIDNPVYYQGVGTASDTAKKVASGQYSQYADTAASQTPQSSAFVSSPTQSAIEPTTELLPGVDPSIATQTSFQANRELADIPEKLAKFIKSNFPKDKFAYENDGLNVFIYDKATGDQKAMYDLMARESRSMSLDQVNVIIESIAAEGVLSKVGGWLKKKGKNLTTKITADKLQKAWKKAGSPTDSIKFAKVLQNAGVSSEILRQIYDGMGIPFPTASNLPSAPAVPAGTGRNAFPTRPAAATPAAAAPTGGPASSGTPTASANVPTGSTASAGVSTGTGTAAPAASTASQATTATPTAGVITPTPAPSAPKTPAQIRQEKQAAATQAARAEMDARAKGLATTPAPAAPAPKPTAPGLNFAAVSTAIQGLTPNELTSLKSALDGMISFKTAKRARPNAPKPPANKV